MDLILNTLRSIAYAIVEPSLALILVLLGVISYIKNKKIVIMQRMILGESINSPLELTLSQMVLGIIAGAIGSLILSHLGVFFSAESGIILIFFISIILMIIKPRFACFSYSGAILGIISLLSGIIFPYIGKEIPIKIDIMALIVLVSVLHIMEGVLIIFDGSRGAVPVFSNKEGKILGGFALNRVWIMPISIFIAITTSGNNIGATISMPEWWPIISTPESMMMLQAVTLALIPNYAGIIYSSVTFAHTKKKKALISGVYVSLFGVILLGISQLCVLGKVGEILAILLMPLAHEMMIYLQRRAENKSNPIYVSDDDGICILEVIPYTPAHQAGIVSGDKILTVNDKKLENENEIYKQIKESTIPVELEIKKVNGSIVNYTVKSDEKKRIGIVLVPKLIKAKDTIQFDSDKFKEILDELKNKANKED